MSTEYTAPIRTMARTSGRRLTSMMTSSISVSDRRASALTTPKTTNCRSTAARSQKSRVARAEAHGSARNSNPGGRGISQIQMRIMPVSSLVRLLQAMSLAESGSRRAAEEHLSQRDLDLVRFLQHQHVPGALDDHAAGIWNGPGQLLAESRGRHSILRPADDHRRYPQIPQDRQ